MTTKAEHARNTMSPHLTEREAEVLQLAVRGMSTKEMAATVHLSDFTIKTHLARLYRRLGVKNRAEAVAVALASGLASTDAVTVPAKVQVYVRKRQDSRTPMSNEGMARRVTMADPTIPITQVVRVIKVLRSLGLLNSRA